MPENSAADGHVRHCVVFAPQALQPQLKQRLVARFPWRFEFFDDAAFAVAELANLASGVVTRAGWGKAEAAHPAFIHAEPQPGPQRMMLLQSIAHYFPDVQLLVLDERGLHRVEHVASPAHRQAPAAPSRTSDPADAAPGQRAAGASPSEPPSISRDELDMLLDLSPTAAEENST